MRDDSRVSKEVERPVESFVMHYVFITQREQIIGALHLLLRCRKSKRNTMSVVIKETPRGITLSCKAFGGKKTKHIILIGNSWSGLSMKDPLSLMKIVPYVQPEKMMLNNTNE